MEAAELALSDLAIWHRLMRMFHSLLKIWHCQAAVSREEGEIRREHP